MVSSSIEENLTLVYEEQLYLLKVLRNSLFFPFLYRYDYRKLHLSFSIFFCYPDNLAKSLPKLADEK